MAITDRSARTIWEGDLETGEGRVSSGIGTFKDVKMSLPSRIGEPNGYSSPEDMLAAAHSGCLAMNLSGVLAKNGTPAETLDVESTVGVGPKDGGGLEVKHANVVIKGKVPGTERGRVPQARRAGGADLSGRDSLPRQHRDEGRHPVRGIGLNSGMNGSGPGIISRAVAVAGRNDIRTAGARPSP